uniref:Aldehyde ferredoxin oxidoreductase n=1 Tax=candidate division WOR-3 bacterium TaxID=2052148 RepID=A0A7C2P6L0_UNCW3
MKKQVKVENFSLPYGGYMGRSLRIDLSNLKAISQPLEENLILKFIGGRGFGIKTLYEEVSSSVDPLSPENRLIIAVGPLMGTGAQGAGRWVAVFKSPLTGIYMRSTGGGFFGYELKRAGYDFLIIEGKSEKPVYLWIKDDTVEFRDAQSLWGMNADAAANFIKEETNKEARMITIGPAGERLVRISAIVTDDSRTAARGGGGAVMGSKNLKGIAVLGTKRVEIKNREAFKEIEKERLEALKRDHHLWPTTPNAFRGLGTNSSTYTWYIVGHLPPYNFNQWELSSIENFRPENLLRYRVGHKGCFGCALKCGKIYKSLYGPYAGTTWEFPELETEWSLGANLGHCNVDAIIYANMLCDIYGLDTISTGVTIAFAIELFQNGILSRSEADGLELKWGDPDVMIELIRRIALRIGNLGNILAEGTRRAAQLIGRGAENYAMQIKGLEMPAYDPRVMKGQGLGLATSTIGASHALVWNKFEILGEPKAVDPISIEGKAELTKYCQDEMAVCETGVFCKIFVNHDIANPTWYAKLLSAVTGIEAFGDPSYLWKVGERIWNLERCYSIREGIKGEEDAVPSRLRKPYPREPHKGQLFELEMLLEDYYRVRGWDKNGVPTKEKLESLDLDYVIPDLYK